MAVEFSNDTDLISVTVPGETQIISIQVPGAQGPPGKFKVGSVATGAPGTSASITAMENAQGEQVVNFVIPRGDVGASNVLTIGSVNTGAAGTAAQASITGTSPSQILNLTIPQGAKGDDGDKGDIGNTGPAGTIIGASATGLASGSSPTVTLGGTPSERTFTFGIPVGANGAPGPANTLTIGTVTTGASGSSAQATITGAAPNQVLNLTIPQGPSGTTPPEATSTVKGSIQLAGDLGGTASAPTVTSGANHTHTATQISNSTTVGRSVLTATDATAARAAIGAGTSNLAIGTTSTTAKAGDYAPPSDGAAGTATMRTLGTGATQAAPGNHTHTATNISDSTATGRSVLTATDAAAARTAIGAQPAVEKASINGIASLNGLGIVPASQAPMSPVSDAAKMLAFSFSNTEMSMRSYVAEGPNLNVLSPLPGVRPVNHPSTNPVYAVRDATVMQYQGQYWMAATRPVKSDYLGPAASPALQVHVSDDLINWRWAYDLPSGVTNAQRAWAPEWFVDEDGSVILYYSVSTQNVAIGSVTQFDIYARRTTDYSLGSGTWGAAILMSGISAATTSGAPSEVIDAQVTKIGNRYCMHVKDEVNMQIMRAWGDSAMGPWTLDRTGNWLNIPGWAEGPQLLRMPNGLWRLSYDRYMENQLCFKESATLDGLATATEQLWTYPRTPYNDSRHPGFIWLSAGEWQAFRARGRHVNVWSSGTQSIPNNVGPTPLTFAGSVGDMEMWNSATPTRLIAPEARIATLHVEVAWPANGTGQRSLAYRKNGGTWIYFGNQNATAGGMGTEMSPTAGSIAMAKNDYIEVGAVQISGAALNINSCSATLKLSSSA